MSGKEDYSPTLDSGMGPSNISEPSRGPAGVDNSLPQPPGPSSQLPSDVAIPNSTSSPNHHASVAVTPIQGARDDSNDESTSLNLASLEPLEPSNVSTSSFSEGASTTGGEEVPAAEQFQMLNEGSPSFSGTTEAASVDDPSPPAPFSALLALSPSDNQRPLSFDERSQTFGDLGRLEAQLCFVGLYRDGRLYRCRSCSFKVDDNNFEVLKQMLDQPWECHAQNSADCEYVKCVRGSKFLSEAGKGSSQGPESTKASNNGRREESAVSGDNMLSEIKPSFAGSLREGEDTISDSSAPVSLQADNQLPKTYDERAQTFEALGTLEAQLCLVGFYWDGCSYRCPSCSFTIGGNDNVFLINVFGQAWECHARNSPDCWYVKHVRGSKFIKECTELESTEKSLPVPGREDESWSSVNALRNRQVENSQNIEVATSGYINQKYNPEKVEELLHSLSQSLEEHKSATSGKFESFGEKFEETDKKILSVDQRVDGTIEAIIEVQAKAQAEIQESNSTARRREDEISASVDVLRNGQVENSHDIEAVNQGVEGLRSEVRINELHQQRNEWFSEDTRAKVDSLERSQEQDRAYIREVDAQADATATTLKLDIDGLTEKVETVQIHQKASDVNARRNEEELSLEQQNLSERIDNLVDPNNLEVNQAVQTEP